MVEDVKSYRKKCLFPVLLFSAMVNSAQIDFPQILGVVYPGTFSTDVSSFWVFLPEFYFLVVVQCLIHIYFTFIRAREFNKRRLFNCWNQCFDAGLELDCVLACFDEKVDETRVFFFVGKISFVFGCD